MVPMNSSTAGMGAMFGASVMAAALSDSKCRKCKHTYKPKKKIVKSCDNCRNSIAGGEADPADLKCWSCKYRDDYFERDEDNWCASMRLRL